MQCEVRPLLQQHQRGPRINLAPPFYSINTGPRWSSNVTSLRLEKEILENGLANCVTYLHVLRKKQARNERRLSTEPALPRRKKKKIQQSKREIEREIQNRERDEQALLNNLQACKTNIYVAEGMTHPSSALSSTIPDYTSNPTQWAYADKSEPTELGWNGWTDDTIISPFHKQRRHSLSVDDIAPGSRSKETSIDEGLDKTILYAPSLVRYADGDGATLHVPSSKAQPRHSHSILSPRTAVFHPKRPISKAGTGHILYSLSLQHRPSLVAAHTQTWCNSSDGTTTPHQIPTKPIAKQRRRASRTNSL